MLIDRKRGPKIKKITRLDIPPFHREILNNGIELIIINIGSQKLTQVEVLQKGSRFLEKKKGVARATAKLLKEGSLNFSGSQIAETIDFYGANISSAASLDYSYAKVFSLSRYLENVLPILEEIIFRPLFSEDELVKYQKTNLEKLKLDQSKSEILAYKSVTEKIFGENHVYGYNSTEETYNDLTIEDLIDYHKHNLSAENTKIIMSGHVTDETIDSIKTMFSGVKPSNQVIKYTSPTTQYQGKSFHQTANDDFQTSVKIGRRLFPRNHPDFNDLFITNTILGGYFSSRLMNTIREQKGYTYNVYSSMDMMMFDGYFNISTEVGNEYVEDTIKTIYEEIEKLQNDLVSERELDMVKNYLSGNFLNMIDGPFKLGGMAKVLALNNLTNTFYQNLMERIHTIDKSTVLKMAQKYFDKKDMVQVVVGNY